MVKPLDVEQWRAEHAAWRASHGPTRRERLLAVLESDQTAEVPRLTDEPQGMTLPVMPWRARVMLEALAGCTMRGEEEWARCDLPTCYQRSVISHGRPYSALDVLGSLFNIVFLSDDDPPDEPA